MALVHATNKRITSLKKLKNLKARYTLYTVGFVQQSDVSKINNNKTGNSRTTSKQQ